MYRTGPARTTVGARGPAERGQRQPDTLPDHQEPATSSQQQQQPPPQPETGSSGYRLIPPNEVRRKKLETNARKEMEDLQRYKEAHRSGPINLPPTKLGGYASLYEARQQQQNYHLQSRYQQQLKREEYKRKQKAQEEAEIQKMKAIQREKAIQLDEKRSQQEKQRRQIFAEDHYQKNTKLLSRLDLGATNGDYSFDQEYGLWEPEPTSWDQEHHAPVVEPSAWARSNAYSQTRNEEEQRQLQQMKAEQQRKGELLECKRKQDETEKAKSLQRDHRRVNNAFLDRLENRNRTDGVHQPGSFRSTYSDFGYCSDQAE